MQTENRETIPIGTRITTTMQNGIFKVLSVDCHINTADYVRDLIRKDLEKRGILVKQIEEVNRCRL